MVKSRALLLDEWWKQVLLFIRTNLSHAHLTSSTLKMGAACSAKMFAPISGTPRHILKCGLHFWPGIWQVRELGSVVTWVWFVTVLKLNPATDNFVQVWSDLPLVCEFLLRCSSRSSDAHFRHPCDRQDINIPAGTSGLLHVYSNWHFRPVRNCKYSLTG